MDTKSIGELAKIYKKFLESLDDETVNLIAKDYTVALSAAKKGIEEIEPDKLNPEYIQQVANELQLIAKMVVNEEM